MKRKSFILLALVAALAVAGCGSDDDGGSVSADGRGIDRAFVVNMIPHHESAVEMAKIAQGRAESEFVKTLADDIIRTQSEELEILRTADAKLSDDGIEPGDLGVPDHMMGMDSDVASLDTATPFDEAFLEMMIPHHEGAVTMAEVQLEKGSDPELKSLAEDIIAAQEREITEMKAELGDDAPSTEDSSDAHHGG